MTLGNLLRKAFLLLIIKLWEYNMVFWREEKELGKINQ